MQIIDIIQRQSPPGPWAEGDNIPWYEPGFSQRMLKEHLSQEHDGASRRFPTIDRHVDWIHTQVLGGQPTKILDVACGPGLYANRLAKLGHTCTGIDYSPASIQYAKECAAEERLSCEFRLEDIRSAEFGTGYGLVMFIYGEPNVFPREKARQILMKARQALVPGGALVMEVHTFDIVKEIGQSPSGWYSSQNGLFKDAPHLYLIETFWDETRSIATKRFFIVDAKTGEVERYGSSMQAYTDEEYRSLLKECGFSEVTMVTSLHGEYDENQKYFFVIVAR